MIRPFTIVSFLAFATAGAWLYQVKHEVTQLDRELRDIARQTEAARERTAILRAEWALLNEPGRLRQVAQQHLQLEPMQPTHFVRLADLERRLPTAVAFAGAPDLFAAPPVAAPQPRPGVMLASVTVPLAPRPAPAPSQTPASETPAPSALAAAVAAQRAQREAAASARPAPAPRPAVQVPAPQPRATPAMQPAVHVAPAPAPAAPVTRVTRATPAEAPVVVASPAAGGVSALGVSAFARPMLPPPVPVAAASTLSGQAQGLR
ncbi:MAG TPA: hypothetical protein VE033_01865 [Acetobacteraceae bacterium]|jgi:hypothetical protein|nr:hypothetical protein [Acetobacteraceae bacterium]